MLCDAGALTADLRRKQGLSQWDLADLAGVHVNTVSNLELGLTDPSTTLYSLVLVALKCPGITICEYGFPPLDPLSDFPGLSDIMLSKPRIVSEIGTRVRDRRADLGLTLRETARAAGIHHNTLWNLENGLVVPSISTMYRLFRAIGFDRVESRSGGIDMIMRS